MRHASIVGGGAASLLANDKTLTAPYIVTIPSTLVAARGMITRLCVVTAAIFGITHGTTSSAGKFVDKIVASKDKEIAQDNRRGRKLPSLILHW